MSRALTPPPTPPVPPTATPTSPSRHRPKNAWAIAVRRRRPSEGPMPLRPQCSGDLGSHREQGIKGTGVRAGGSVCAWQRRKLLSQPRRGARALTSAWSGMMLVGTRLSPRFVRESCDARTVRARARERRRYGTRRWRGRRTSAAKKQGARRGRAVERSSDLHAPNDESRNNSRRRGLMTAKKMPCVKTYRLK